MTNKIRAKYEFEDSDNIDPFEQMLIKCYEYTFGMKDLVFLSNLSEYGISIWVQNDFSLELLNNLNKSGIQSISFDFFKNPIETQVVLKVLINKFIQNLQIGNEAYWAQKINGKTNTIGKEFHLRLKKLVNSLSEFCPDVEYRFIMTTEEEELMQKLKSDKINFNKQPNRLQKLYALQQFCPELITALIKKTSKDLKGEILYLITGVNKEDCYKFLFTSNARDLDKIDGSKIDSLKIELDNK